MRVIAGPEKKARLLSEKEQRITAYHEMGHALVGHFLETRTRAQDHDRPSRAGARLDDSLPTEDRYIRASRRYQRDRDDAGRPGGGRPCVPRGHDGAANDLEKVTDIANGWSCATG